jgi:hypothetical protein
MYAIGPGPLLISTVGLITLLSLILLILIVVEAAGGDLVQPEDGLVRILDKDELALVAPEAHVGDGADNTPSVRE